MSEGREPGWVPILTRAGRAASYPRQFSCVGAVLGFKIIVWRMSLAMNGP